jgi:hypothetical protein
VVTISGSGSGSANAQYQGVFGVAEGTADATSSALGVCPSKGLANDPDQRRMKVVETWAPANGRRHGP